MDLCGGGMRVYHQRQDSKLTRHDKTGALLVCEEYSPLTYCWIEVRDEAEVVKSIITMQRKLHRRAIEKCVQIHRGSLCLRSLYLWRLLNNTPENSEVLNNNPADDDDEVTLCLVGSGPPTWAESCVKRWKVTGWPSSQGTLRQIYNFPGLLAMGGKKKCPNGNTTFSQISSGVELLLARELSLVVRQAYCAFRHCFEKYFLKLSEGVDVLPLLYCLKHVLFHTMTQSALALSTEAPIRLVLELFQNLQTYLLYPRKLPHFIFPSVNVLEDIPMDVLEVARNTIAFVVSNLTTAIINSPSNPSELYGDDLSCEDIAGAFRTALVTEGDIGRLYRQEKFKRHDRHNSEENILLQNLITESKSTPWVDVSIIDHTLKHILSSRRHFSDIIHVAIYMWYAYI